MRLSKTADIIILLYDKKKMLPYTKVGYCSITGMRGHCLGVASTILPAHKESAMLWSACTSRYGAQIKALDEGQVSRWEQAAWYTTLSIQAGKALKEKILQVAGDSELLVGFEGWTPKWPWRPGNEFENVFVAGTECFLWCSCGVLFGEQTRLVAPELCITLSQTWVLGQTSPSRTQRERRHAPALR